MTLAPRIDGPRLAPASGRPAKHLVIFLHGYGANGQDLIDIGRHWAYAMPETAFVSPDAPEPCPEAPMGRQWFAISQPGPNDLWKGVSGAAPALDQFIDAELQRHALGPESLALVGFSQGTMMALHVGLRRAQPLAGIVGYSGLLAGAEHLPHDIKSRPPVLLVHGDEDPLIPVAALPHAANSLAEVGVNTEWHIRPGLAHGIDNEGLDLGAEFLRRVFGDQPG